MRRLEGRAQVPVEVALSVGEIVLQKGRTCSKIHIYTVPYVSSFNFVDFHPGISVLTKYM